jgi:benzoylformate decarboxylase
MSLVRDAETRTGSDLLVEILEEYGVEHVFGNPGTTELPLLKSLEGSPVDYIVAAHEDVAVGMGAGYANAKRAQTDDPDDEIPLGFVNIHMLPGTGHAIGNLYGAMLAGAPILVTAGNHSSQYRHTEPILSGEPAQLVTQVTKWTDQVRHVDALAPMVRRAVSTALTPPMGPVFLELPLDVMLTETSATPERFEGAPSPGPGDPDAIADAADALVAASDPVLVVGDNVGRSGPDAIDATVRLAEKSGARVAPERIPSGTSFPTDHPQWIPYSTSIDGPRLSADVIVYIGCTRNAPSVVFNDDWTPQDSLNIHVNYDDYELGKERPADVSILGDPGDIARELSSAVANALPDSRRDSRLNSLRNLRRTDSSGAGDDSKGAGDTARGGIPLSTLAETMRDVAPDAVVVDESLTSKSALFDAWDFGPGQFFGNKGAGLGYGLPASIGAALAESASDNPSPVYGFIGDGSYLYYPQSLHTAARYDIDVTVVIPNNSSYRILKNNMNTAYEEVPEEGHEYIGLDFEESVNYAANAESYGANGIAVTDREQLREGLRTARENDGPFVVDVPIQ